MSRRDHPRCLGWHREGECRGCLWERECRARTLLKGAMRDVRRS